VQALEIKITSELYSAFVRRAGRSRGSVSRPGRRGHERSSREVHMEPEVEEVLRE
jgi:hypothetical protein